jgi:hypothetical protein
VRLANPLAVAALLLPGFDVAAESAKEVRAVMYEFTYDAESLIITHAQVVGGYPSVDACKEAMARVSALGNAQAEPGEKIQLECSGIREVQPDPKPVY